MKTYKVKQVAQLAGISIRALHHYDQIGLLAPAFVGENNYRFYTRDELVRLQHILFFKDMGLSLEEIRGALEKPRSEQAHLLAAHRDRLAQESRRQLQLLKTIDRTIAALNGAEKMKTQDLYKGFSEKKQAGYESLLIETYGPRMKTEIQAARAKLATDSDGGREHIIAQRMTELADIEGEIVLALESGVEPTDASLSDAISRHHKWVAQWWDKDLDQNSYIGLASMYKTHPDFVARYEAIAPGLTDYLVDAMTGFAKRHLN